ncbi:MAG: hypothetical protein ACRDTF_17840 [Pseudonocardiaceae bacterium]
MLAVLAGSPLDQVATGLGMTTAENTAATHLGPQVQRLQDTGVITAWWFIRKAPGGGCASSPATTSSAPIWRLPPTPSWTHSRQPV